MEMNSDPEVIPGGLTSVLHSPDVSDNKPFNSHVRKLYMQWMAGHEMTLTGKIRRPSTEIMSDWIV
jgi:hypothetical protein